MLIPKPALIVGAVALVGVVGLMLPKNQAPATQPAPRATTTPAAKAKPSTPSECIPVSDAFAQQILGDDLKLVKASAAKGETSYFVAIRFTHDAGTDTGVWQAANLDGGPFASVNAFAKSYTRWPDSGNQGAKAQRVAEECLRGR